MTMLIYVKNLQSQQHKLIGSFVIQVKLFVYVSLIPVLYSSQTINWQLDYLTMKEHHPVVCH